MRHLMIAAAVLLSPSMASATCTGTGNYRYCTDNSGNSYSINRYGNSTQMQGSNARTGSNWSQQSYRNGNTTQTYGNDSQGNSWSSTSTPTGTFGTDSSGRSFYTPNYGYRKRQ